MGRVGVHCSVRDGLPAAVQEAQGLGCETMQIFTRSPRMWRRRTVPKDEIQLFRKLRSQSGIHPIAVHSPYLPNLCTSDESLYQRSRQALLEDLDFCGQIGADYMVIHPGAFSPDATLEMGIQRLVMALNGALKQVSNRTKILLENVAGGGRRIGSRFEEIRTIVEQIQCQNRIGICFDTCHALGAGYNLSTTTGVEETWSEFDKYIGLSRIFVFHVNDSKAPLGSHRDLHQHLGKKRNQKFLQQKSRHIQRS